MEDRRGNFQSLDNSGNYRITWDNFSDVLTDVNNTPALPSASSRSNSHGASWSGTDTFEQAVKLCNNGWPEGMAKIKERSEANYAKISKKIARPETTYMVYGDTVDMGRYLEGDPECFMTTTESELTADSPGHIVHIVFNGAVSAGISEEVIFRKGAAIVALADLLELSGRRAHIDVVYGIGSSYFYGGGGSGSILEARVTVKRPDQPLNLDVLAFTLAHQASLRRLGFAAVELAPANVRSKYGIPSGGYGYPADIKDNRGDLYIPSSGLWQDVWKDEASTQAWIEKQLKEQGVTFNEYE